MKQSSFVEMVNYSIQIFLDDGTIDMAELNKLMELAMTDGMLDDYEIRALESIFSKVNETEVTQEVWKKIITIRASYKENLKL